MQDVCAIRTPARGDEAVKNETDNEDGNNDNLQFSNPTTQRNAKDKEEPKTEGMEQRW